LDFFSHIHTKVPIQKPEKDGVNYFYKYFNLPLSEFSQRIKAGENLYIGARKISKAGGERTDEHGLGELVNTLKIPAWLEPERISSTNLWAGAGNNQTLLHYDPWDSILLLGQGEKMFLVYPDSESHRIPQYSPLDYKALYQGKVLHSKVRPRNVQQAYQAKLSKVEGFKGTINAGEVMFIPAGFWHYVESTGVNIGINFFAHFTDRSLQFSEPLRAYWIKDNITLWPVRWFMNLRFKVFSAIRRVFPKKG